MRTGSQHSAVAFGFFNRKRNPVAAIIYGIVEALQACEGKEFRHWLIADWVKV